MWFVPRIEVLIHTPIKYTLHKIVGSEPHGSVLCKIKPLLANYSDICRIFSFKIYFVVKDGENS